MPDNIGNIVQQTYRRTVWRLAIYALLAMIAIVASVFGLVAAYAALQPLYGAPIAALLVAAALVVVMLIFAITLMIESASHQRETEKRKQALGAASLVPVIGSLIGIVGPVRVLKTGAFVTKHAVRNLPLIIGIGAVLFAASRYAKSSQGRAGDSGENSYS